MISIYIISVMAALLTPVNEPRFESQVVDANVAIGYGLAIGDVDGNGKADILLADKKEFVWYRNGDWKRFVMVGDLTESDNVCIAARDIDGDGKVEVAVGAQWNPGETSDAEKSGSVHYLVRPDDPTQKWTAVKLHHEPTIHRMHWVKTGDRYQLIVLPLHGRGNKDGEGQGVKVTAYEVPDDPSGAWKHSFIDESMHLTHNFDPLDHNGSERLYVGGKEGIKIMDFEKGAWVTPSSDAWFMQGNGVGEVRVGRMKGNDHFITTIEPMHGNQLVVYADGNDRARTVLTSDLKQGHALATADLLGMGSDQIVAGWREANDENRFGVKLYVAQNEGYTVWKDHWIDEGGMACEDLKIADLDGDGLNDIIAAGRATHNLKIYWNRSK